MYDERFDLVVIGSGPAGQKGAIAASKLGRRVAVVDRAFMLGGVCLHTGTIPSKTLREAVLYLTGLRQRAFYGERYRLHQRIQFDDLMLRVHTVVERQLAVVRRQLQRNGIAVLDGEARFLDPHRLEVKTELGPRKVRAEHVLIACGTRPARPDDIPFDERILDPDGIVGAVGGELPHSALVVGAGIIGLEYASMLAALDIAVTVIDARDELLPFADRDVLAGFERHMTASGARFYLSRKLVRVARQGSGVEAQLDKGERLRADLLLYAVGRQPNTDRLDLAAAGVPVDACGRVAVDAEFRTAVRHICAAGDVIGFPALASTSMEQGRLAACYLFGAPARHAPALLPYGIYTIPEMAMVGRTEEQLRAEGTAYAVGIARFEELAKAQIIGDSTGLLKLLFCPDSHQLLGVHALGDGVSELLHIGQSVLALGGTVEFLRDNVFNYPTLAEAYRVAAIDGLNRLGRPRRPVV